MNFVKKSADITPIVDNVFSIVAKAKQDKAQNGAENVIDATIGSLYGEDEKLVALKEVFNHYDEIDHRSKAAYAASFTGNPDYRKAVEEWVLQGTNVKLNRSVIATPGGSGAVSMAFTTFLDAGQTIILPDIAWGSYTLMAHENGINYEKYQMFDGDAFNIQSLKDTVLKVLETQDRIVVVLNDPCHNPTGYSLSIDEWKELVTFMNEISQKVPFILINDIAYIDYSNHLDTVRDYMNTWNDLSNQVMVVACFSCSKTLTSYGLRCGAALVLAHQQEDVREAEIIMEKKARATWSNIPNAAMQNFVWLVNEGREKFLAEKQSYIDLMAKRSSIFIEEANAVDLPFYPYKEGFFVTVKIEDLDRCSRIHSALMDKHIYTVQVNKGIRVAVCSLPVAKVYGLAKVIKETMDEVK